MGRLFKPSSDVIVHELYKMVKTYNRRDNILADGVSMKVTSTQKIQALKVISEILGYIALKEKRDKDTGENNQTVEFKF